MFISHVLGGSLPLGELEEEVKELLVVHEGDTELVEEHHQALLHVWMQAAIARGQELQEWPDDGLVHQHLLLGMTQQLLVYLAEEGEKEVRGENGREEHAEEGRGGWKSGEGEGEGRGKERVKDGGRRGWRDWEGKVRKEGRGNGEERRDRLRKGGKRGRKGEE